MMILNCTKILFTRHTYSDYCYKTLFIYYTQSGRCCIPRWYLVVICNIQNMMPPSFVVFDLVWDCTTFHPSIVLRLDFIKLKGLLHFNLVILNKSFQCGIDCTYCLIQNLKERDSCWICVQIKSSWKLSFKYFYTTMSVLWQCLHVWIAWFTAHLHSKHFFFSSPPSLSGFLIMKSFYLQL